MSLASLRELGYLPALIELLTLAGIPNRHLKKPEMRVITRIGTETFGDHRHDRL